MSAGNDQLTNTSYVLLGFLAPHAHSGYDIKRGADHSTRFFWQISYGQIYPELKHLVELGLAEQETGSRGGRTRHLYRITEAGRAALIGWLGERKGPSTFEMRDELLLKLFFCDAAGPKAKGIILEQMRLREEAIIAEFRAMQPHAIEAAADHGPTMLEVLQGGIKIHQAYLAHLRELEQNLS